MSYHLAHIQPDGRLTTPLPIAYGTLVEARTAATEHLEKKRPKIGGRLVLVQVVEEAVITTSVEWRCKT